MLRRALRCLAQRPQLASSSLLRSVAQPAPYAMPASSTSFGASSTHYSPMQQQQQLGLSTLRSIQQQLTGNWNSPQQHAKLQLCSQSPAATFSNLTPLNSTKQDSNQLQQHSAQDQQQPAQQLRPYFWNKLSSKIPSRKPAIKRPARHQWHYCSPDYDPMAPLPKQHLPPYAPARAHEKDYRKIYFAGKPLHNRKRYKRMWQKNMAIADQRWRQAWEARLAAKRKEDAKLQRLTERMIRQRSWEAWKADQAAAAQQQISA